MKTRVAVLLLLVSFCSAQDPRKLTSMSAPGPLTFAAVCDGGREMIGISKEKGVFVWDVASGQSTPLNIKTRRTSDGTCAAKAPYAAMVVAREGRVILVDLRKRVQVKEFTFTQHIANAAALSPDGKTILAAPDDGPAKIIDVATGAMKTLQTDFGASVNVAFSPDGQLMATADEDTNVRIYSRDGKLLSAVSYGRVEPFGIAFSGDGKRLFVAGGDFSVHAYESATGKLLASSEKVENPIWLFSRSGDSFVALSLDKKTLAPAALYRFDPAATSVTKLGFDPAAYVGWGDTAKGWALVKSEGDTVSIWELAANSAVATSR